jgi:hypothetical protein
VLAGYQRLITFLTKEKGYEWFGKSPANEALSAYGLAEFTDMAKVTNFVDPVMLSQLKSYLLGKKNGKGGFLRSTGALDTFGSAPDNTTTAYIVWSLTCAGVYDVATEINALIVIANG